MARSVARMAVASFGTLPIKLAQEQALLMNTTESSTTKPGCAASKKLLPVGQAVLVCPGAYRGRPDQAPDRGAHLIVLAGC